MGTTRNMPNTRGHEKGGRACKKRVRRRVVMVRCFFTLPPPRDGFLSLSLSLSLIGRANMVEIKASGVLVFGVWVLKILFSSRLKNGGWCTPGTSILRRRRALAIRVGWCEMMVVNKKN